MNDFVEIWNNKKYDQDKNTPFTKWKAIQSAEMQKHEIAHPIGYMARSTERGLYDTLIRGLEEVFNNEINQFSNLESINVSGTMPTKLQNNNLGMSSPSTSK